MLAKLIFTVGVLGIGGYVGHTAWTHDPEVFAISREQLKTRLVAARTRLPRRDGEGFIEIWSTGGTARGVALQMRYSEIAPIIDCQADITAIDPEHSRVVPDCRRSSTESESAISQTVGQLHTAMFDEHLQATLNDRAFNRRRVDSLQVGAALRGMSGMQREALRAHDEMQQMEAEER